MKKNNKTTISALVVALVCTSFFTMGIWVGGVSAQNDAVKLGLAHFDPNTGERKWGVVHVVDIEDSLPSGIFIDEPKRKPK